MQFVRPFLAAPLLCLLCVSPAIAQNVITYQVEPRTAEKAFQVRMDIPQVRELTVRVQIPVWSPGAYISGNYAADITDLSAEDGVHKPLKIYHPDQNTWEIAANGANLIHLRYKVTNVDTAETEGAPKRAHLVGPRTYLYVVGRKAEPVALSLATPTGAKVWKIATSLDPMVISARTASDPALHEFTAPSYDVLADAPVEMGDFTEQRFEAGGKPHSVVLYGDYKGVDRAKLVGFCKKVAETETAFFGDAPYHRYVFQFRANAARTGGGGGLEHLGSTEISISSLIDDGVRSVIAHEYFHLWNVKRIRPFVLGPFDYVDPPRTANLWWSEGVTSYYGDLLSRRGGLNTDAEYLKHLSDTITALQNNPARLKVSADQSSLHVFDANNSQGFGGLSYYTKGELIGLCLDLKIRETTHSAHSLDDVMHALYAQCGGGDDAGFAEDDIKKTVNRISGQDLSDFYDLLARSTGEMPFTEAFTAVGLNCTRSETPVPVPDAGMTLQPDRRFQSLSVGEITTEGAAAKAGLKPGDKIAAINDQTEMRAMGRLLRTTLPGKALTITVVRDGARIPIAFTMGSANRFPWLITPDPSATPEKLRLRREWLTGK
jgi:predicted metalloprotease with PDZ domain